MPSARARLGAVRRKIAKRQRKADVVSGVATTAATVLSFAGGQAKKADTAWGEYEAGYKELGGEGFERPKFGQKGYFKGPEGEVRIGNTMYDRSKIQKAGGFLGSDAASILSDEQRQQYLGRTAPGTALPTFTKSLDVSDYTGGQTGGGVSSWSLTGGGTGGRFSPVTPKTVSTSRGIGVSASLLDNTGFGQGTFTGDVQHELAGKDFQPYQKSSFRMRREDIDLTPKTIESGSQIPKITYGRDELSSEEVKIKEAQEKQWRLDRMPDPYQENKFPWQKEGEFSFARGGDFITNGPQKILVGDNPGGRERVTIKPLSSKNDAKFGRYGDDAMKIIDGQPAHIDSSIEGDMSQEDIKKYGAGTINPITGKKEYFLPLAAGLLAIGSSLYKGFSAQGNKADVAAGKQAAGDIYQEQVGMYGEQKDLTTQAIENQFTGASRDIRFGLEAGQEDIAYATGKTNLPTSGTLKTQEEDLLEKAKSDITKLVETRDLSRTEADLSYRKGEMSAEDAYQNTLTGLESVQTGFWEGFFG